MRRGTTPTLTFTLPFSTKGMDVLNLAFSQKDNRGRDILVLQMFDYLLRVHPQ